MTDQEEPWKGRMGEEEELPQMDGSCDACEPDEAQPATQVCHTCSFAFCPSHAERHTGSTHHQLTPYGQQGAHCQRAGTNRDTEGEAGVRMGNVGRVQENMSFLEAEIQGLGARVLEIADQGVARIDENGAYGGDMEHEEGAGDAKAVQAVGAEVEGDEEGEEARAAPEAGKRDTVTVERLRCKEHGQEGSLYCKLDEKVICVVCAVQGEHHDHEIITLHEAYVWQKSRDGYDLLGCTQQMAEKIKTKWTHPEMCPDELEAYVDSQFDVLHKLVRLEEKRTLHLVDLKEAFLTAAAAEKIAEITVHTERLQEEMACITEQLGQLDQAEREEAASAAAGAPGLSPRPAHDIEARPRIPEPRRAPQDRDRRDYGEGGSGSSMGHAP